MCRYVQSPVSQTQTSFTDTVITLVNATPMSLSAPPTPPSTEFHSRHPLPVSLVHRTAPQGVTLVTSLLPVRPLLLRLSVATQISTTFQRCYIRGGRLFYRVVTLPALQQGPSSGNHHDHLPQAPHSTPPPATWTRLPTALTSLPLHWRLLN